MKFLRFNKKEKECGCGGDCKCKQQESVSSDVKVLGTGCKKCNQLADNTKLALEELEMKDGVEHVTDLAEIALLGVMSTPALMVDGVIVSMGTVLSKDEIVVAIKKVRA